MYLRASSPIRASPQIPPPSCSMRSWCVRSRAYNPNLTLVMQNLSYPATREQALKMLGNATSRRDHLNREQELAHARHQAAKNKAKLRGLQARNARKALRAANYYVSCVRSAIGNSKHKGLLLCTDMRCATDVGSDTGESRSTPHT
jgi:cyanophycinase-like exopeptidase